MKRIASDLSIVSELVQSSRERPPQQPKAREPQGRAPTGVGTYC
jgi:hypothetical protein